MTKMRITLLLTLLIVMGLGIANAQTIEKKEATAATCFECGNEAYWHDVENKKYYKDEACTQEFSPGAWIIQPLDHKFENDVCALCGTNREQITIYYTTTDGKVADPAETSSFGANVVSNSYINGRGVITFDGVVTRIADDAFMGKTNLASIVIPSGVTVIGQRAFQKCNALKSITIPKGVREIQKRAFYNCSKLKEIILHAYPSMAADAFSGIASGANYQMQLEEGSFNAAAD